MQTSKNIASIRKELDTALKLTLKQRTTTWPNVLAYDYEHNRDARTLKRLNVIFFLSF